MRLREIYVSGFGKFCDKSVTLSDGMNIIYGENGSGKTTLHAFIKAMLFGMERGRGRAASTDEYTHYLPWNTAQYGGSLTLEDACGQYVIERNLASNTKSLKLRRASSGAVLSTSQDDINDIMGGLTEEAFRNTMSIEQLHACTDSALSAELKNHLSSVALAGVGSLDVDQAVSDLRGKKKELRRDIDKDAPAQYNDVVNEIFALEDSLPQPKEDPEVLEADIADLKARLEAEETNRLALGAELEGSRMELNASPMANITDPEIYMDHMHDSYNAYRLAAANVEGPGGRGRTAAAVICAVLLAAAGAAALVCSFMGLIPAAFSSAVLPAAVAAFAVSVICIAAAVTSSARRRRTSSDSAAMLAETKAHLENEFAAHLGDSAISEENLSALGELASSHGELLKKINAQNRVYEESLGITISLQEQLSEKQEALSACQKESWELSQAFEKLSELEDQKAALSRKLEQNKKSEESLEAITLAVSTIEELSAKIHEYASPALNAEVSHILGKITGGLYDRVFIDESLNISVKSGGRVMDVSMLSRGTIEQVYLALRISAVHLLYPGTDLPLILDDTFAYYDDERLENTLSYLSGEYSGQVLILTCQKREAAALQRMGAAYQFTALDQED